MREEFLTLAFAVRWCFRDIIIVVLIRLEFFLFFWLLLCIIDRRDKWLAHLRHALHPLFEVHFTVAMLGFARRAVQAMLAGALFVFAVVGVLTCQSRNRLLHFVEGKLLLARKVAEFFTFISQHVSQLDQFWRWFVNSDESWWRDPFAVWLANMLGLFDGALRIHRRIGAVVSLSRRATTVFRGGSTLGSKAVGAFSIRVGVLSTTGERVII